ncbi:MULTISPECIES: RDD family protein [Alteromonadaceae]|uniref:RDD family protein n=1 Tax=Alteromonadaceae TaxID=72275 RepID=UPI001C083A74|nr:MULTISPECIES: RDD family protein [Aliiglaciecola]MBU2878475.1 RDD family protein [Aliiglaciecola lipolytica]MDO6709709.1 RDD family protein [Aliiglaciecola sp. 2_MG-2023]MDO6750749.1 RDD family protein [Aliiglaciecola sp. 1_MG-2023]
MTQTTQHFPRAGFFKRLAAMVYDILVAVAIGMCAGLIYSVIGLMLFENGIIDKQGFTHFMDFTDQSLWFRISEQIWVGFWILVFFLWFWRNGGQTIGMRAWRLRLFSTTDQPLGYGRALMRIIFSLGGLGTLLVLFDVKNKQSLQDRLAGTEMLVLSKDANHHRAWKSL